MFKTIVMQRVLQSLDRSGQVLECGSDNCRVSFEFVKLETNQTVNEKLTIQSTILKLPH